MKILRVLLPHFPWRCEVRKVKWEIGPPPRFNGGFQTSRDIEQLGDGAPVTAAGLVIRRQRPRGKVVLVTLEDEFGHIPCMVFGQTYERYEHQFRSPFLIFKGRLTRREGTRNVVIQRVKPFSVLDKVPQSKDWR